ncbi:hypothetical protein [Streptomyces xanthophaeus]|uniref:Uncharacterized protein n=1 Tax=Streptomyces xanthophaeus TaxID=67385 RepID=A0A919GTI3_9ACTN|nr:hypothetical protein [Streptomyces xanthophaeus]GHI84117.1 hypothetical protein Sxan_14810 [Streptomyces xanthophaeus]
MAVWLIRAGGSGDPFLPQFHEYNAAVFSYKEGEDIRGLTKEEMIARFEGKPYLDPDRAGEVISAYNAGRYARELIKIRDEVKRGDYLYTSVKGRKEYLIGRVKKNPYEYHPEHDRDHRHIVRTKWAAPVLAADLGELFPYLNTARRTIRIPEQQEELAEYAAQLFV